MSTMRELKGRIGSVQSSQKITSAMKMISSAKLRKAEIALKHVVPFRDQIQSTINNLLGADSDYQSPLTEQRPVQRVAFVIFGSDEGLCGAFNVQLYKSLIDSIDILRESSDSTIEVTVYPIGKKVKSLVAKTPGIQVRPVEYLSSKSTPDTLKRFSDELTEAFLAHEFDRIEVVYAYYKSVASQVMKTRLLLPISIFMNLTVLRYLSLYFRFLCVRLCKRLVIRVGLRNRGLVLWQCKWRVIMPRIC